MLTEDVLADLSMEMGPAAVRNTSLPLLLFRGLVPSNTTDLIHAITCGDRGALTPADRVARHQVSHCLWGDLGWVEWGARRGCLAGCAW